MERPLDAPSESAGGPLPPPRPVDAAAPPLAVPQGLGPTSRPHADARAAFRQLQPGELVSTWRVLLALTWVAAFFAYAAVWQASVQLGIGTWWIGPRAQPTPAIVRLIPFLVCLGVILVVVYGRRRLPLVSGVCASGLLLFAIPDFSRSTSLAATELVIALGVLVVSALATTGVARPVAPGQGGDIER